MANAKLNVVQRNSYATPAPSKWVVSPGLLVADKGDTVQWRVYDDTKDLTIALDDLNHLFVPGSFVQTGKKATAKISPGAQSGYYEYRLFWGTDEVEGGSAPGVIIE